MDTKAQMESYQQMFQCVKGYLDTVEEVLPPPLHSQLSDQWWAAIRREWSAVLGEAAADSPEFQEKAKEVFECFQVGYSAFSESLVKQEKASNIQKLLQLPQSVQRTDEWYKEMREVLSASEFWELFSSPRTRALLVMSKVTEPTEEPTTNRKCCLTTEMTPMDWGIRFEPIARQILEKKWECQITELGRIRHPSLKGLAASPDGLITQTSGKFPELLGNLVEIKCPSSRVIGKQIPTSYWYQMQLQLEVTESPDCQYAEFCFRSGTAAKPMLEKEPIESIEKGVCYILQNEELLQMKYEYGPLGAVEWTPTLEEGWEIMERIPWFLESMWIKPVVRDIDWFESIVPVIEAFWEDVEKAKRGEFQVPESKMKKRAAVCAIQDD